ncbi:MAG: hypothetical protein ACFFD4_04845 [Candidatus Odinarchaeota archaeon]
MEKKVVVTALIIVFFLTYSGYSYNKIAEVVSFDTDRSYLAKGQNSYINATYGGSDSEVGISLFQTVDGGYVLAGNTQSFGAGENDLWLVKTDANGDLEWNQTYGGTEYDYLFSGIQTNDGGFALAGYTVENEVWTMWLVKTDGSGNQSWNKTYSRSETGYAHSVIQTTDNGFALASEDMRLVKTDANGQLEWIRTFGRTGTAYSVIQTIDGGFALAGDAMTTESGTDAWVVKTDANGQLEWDRTYRRGKTDSINSIIQTTEGGYILGGWTQVSPTSSNVDMWLIKTDGSGQSEWNRTFGGTRIERIESIIQTAYGGIIIAGWTTSYGAGFDDIWLIETDEQGILQWNCTYGGTSGESCRDIIQTNDGGVAVIGRTLSYGAGSSDMWLVKVPASDIPVLSLNTGTNTGTGPSSKPVSLSLIVVIVSLLLTGKKRRRKET